MGDARKTLIVAGNCQAKNIADIFRRNPIVAERYRILYPAGAVGLDGNVVTEADAAGCDVLFQQVGGRGDIDFVHRDKLNPSAHIVRFPCLMLFFLYPFHSSLNPYNVPRPPALPWGLFPYPDTVILDLVDQGLPAAEILDIYLNRYERYAADFDRLFRMEHARSVELDAMCDFPTTDFLFSTFRSSRQFFTTFHPTPFVFARLIEEIAAKCAAFDLSVACAQIGETFKAILQSHPRGPHYSQVIPIHPKTHEQYGLEWYDPSERFEVGNQLLSYADYYGAMIAEFIRVKAEQEAASVLAG